MNLDATESGIWKVSTTGSTATAIINTLYDSVSEDIALQRKLVRARSILSGDMRRSAPYEEGPSALRVATGDQIAE